MYVACKFIQSNILTSSGQENLVERVNKCSFVIPLFVTKRNVQCMFVS
jgi:hypothetical protein